ncbi:MAG: hypothetical protein ABIT38_03050, partial [Gemmatimonadaceae bacterium]
MRIRAPLTTMCCLSLCTSPAWAQRALGDSARGDSTTRVITPGARYRAGWLHKMVLGDDYRALWTTPIEVDVLDLRATAGGLRPTQRGGSMQTKSLRFRGGDGREYVFRPAEKDFSKSLPPALRETLVSDIAQDQVSGYHPAAALVVASLLDATGLHHPRPRLFVMPNDPLLGEFRADFAGVLGTLEERPARDFDDSAESLGATDVVSSERLFEHLRKSHEHRVDTHAYLAARLFDIVVGDRDRHRDQWRWGRFSADKNAMWEPIPRDRDMPFAKFEGAGPWAIRGFAPQMVSFDAKYPSMVWLNWNAREIDRRLLVGLSRAEWESAVRELQAQLSDSVIRAAVAQMPAPFQKLDGEELIATLITRRERLPKAGAEFYELLAREVNVAGTDAADLAQVTRETDGAVRVRLSTRKSSASGTADSDATYFDRRFLPGETHEVRIHLLGGDDRVAISGARRGDILVRIVGGDGDDVIIDSIPNGDAALRIYDS